VCPYTCCAVEPSSSGARAMQCRRCQRMTLRRWNNDPIKPYTLTPCLTRREGDSLAAPDQQTGIQVRQFSVGLPAGRRHAQLRQPWRRSGACGQAARHPSARGGATRHAAVQSQGNRGLRRYVTMLGRALLDSPKPCHDAVAAWLHLTWCMWVSVHGWQPADVDILGLQHMW
jgi:hypothetical protein